MTTKRSSRPRPSQFRAVPTGPSVFIMGTDDELAVLEPVARKAGLSVLRQRLDPPTLDIETIVLDEELSERIGQAALAIVIADVIGDDRLPLISFVDESLSAVRPLLVSCTQAGATEQSAICQHAERVVGFGPLGLLSGRQIVEIAPSLRTESWVLEQASAFFQQGGVAVHSVGDAPGLVLARILAPIVNEAAFALTEKLASAADIDTAVQLGANFPFGPLHWADQIGLDRILLAMEYLVQSTYEERYRPAPLIRRLAQAGFTGKAAGRGFFEYAAESDAQA